MIYKDNVGDIYNIPSEYIEYIWVLDNLISDTCNTSLHDPLVDAWEVIVQPYRYDCNE
jgi:hypothetical protein